MKKPLLITVILFLVSFGSIGAQEPVVNSDSIRSLALDEALKCIKMTQKDLTLRKDYVDIDSFRLEIINHLMINPMQSLNYSQKISSQLLSSVNFRDLIFISGSEMGFRIKNEKLKIQNEKQNVEEMMLRFLNKDKKSLNRSEKKCISQAQRLPKKLRESLAILLWGMTESKRKIAQAINDLSQEEIDSLIEYMPLMLEEDVEDEFKSAEELDEEQKYEEKLLEDMRPILEKIKREKIFQAGMDMALSLDEAKKNLYELTSGSYHLTNREIFERDTVLHLRTDLGDLIIGGVKSNRYQGSPALIIDLGGEDEYYLSCDRENKIASTIIIDLGGDDLYKTEDRFGFGSGFFGVSFLIDRWGDDLYMAQDFSLGSGFFGVGVLLDEEGNDKYLGDTFTQGAGSFGLGILMDVKGNDEYSSALFAQGFGYVAGFGALLDSVGNDSYFAGGKYKDILRYEDHYVSLSQGFAFGSRPDLSGGLGFLCDGKGNDVYNSDIFGQGSSYWFALGALLDHAGNDKYVSYQYAQGAGIHLSLGVLIDERGDDVYISKGVSQGCGHDLAFGLLLDQKGDDSYSAYDLSQGAGSANGIGMIIDESGDDGYLVKRTHNTQGYGNPRREYGSIGLLLDLSGKDNYGGNGADNSYWIIPSKWGAGVDFDFSKQKTENSKQ
jgi:hypothetical protein